MSVFDSRKFPEDEEWEIIDKIFRFYNKDSKRKFHPVECIIYNNIDNINVIYKTKQFTLPNLKKLSSDLSLSDKNKEVPRNVLLKLISNFEKEIGLQTEGEIKEIDKIKENLEAEVSDKILLESLLKDVRIQSIGRLLDFFEEQEKSDFQFLLHARPKAGDNIYENFNSLLGLKMAKINGIYEYFVGKKKESLQFSLPASCIIRSVTPWINGEIEANSEIFLDEFAHMLTVEFVRNGQFTVTPFPMKYLNEYKKFFEKDEEFDE